MTYGIMAISDAIKAIGTSIQCAAIDANKTHNKTFLADKKKFDELFAGYDYDGDYIHFDEPLEVEVKAKAGDNPAYKKVAYGLALLYVTGKYIVGEAIDSAKKKHKSAFC